MNPASSPAWHSLFAVALFVCAGVGIAAEPTKLPLPPTDTQLGLVGGSRAEVLQRCKRLGMAPVNNPPLAGGAPDAAGRIEAAASNLLSEAGFEVVGSAAYNKAFDSFNRAVGGIHNKMTGALRPDAAAGVNANAQREFFDQEHLDCVAWVSVPELKINVAGKSAEWDGVRERINGQLATGGLSDVFFSNGDMNGSLAAISVQVQIRDRENKVLFGRRGGIQLASYHDPRHREGPTDFLTVPRASLLKDDKRIERGLRYAIVPLRYSPEEILAGANDPVINTTMIKLQDLPAPPAGIVVGQDLGLKAPREQVLSTVHRVVLGPLYAGNFVLPAGTADRYRALVRQELARLGWEVLDADNLPAIAVGAMTKVGGTYDPLTGSPDATKVGEMMHEIFAGLALTPPPEALITIALVKTVAPQTDGNATWDDAAQSALTLGAVVKGPKLFGGTANPSAGEGVVAASALRVLLRDSSNVTLYDRLGGIELLQQLSLISHRVVGGINFEQKLTDRAPQELFRDEARDQHAVHAALRGLVMTAAEIAAENQPENSKRH